VLGICQSHPAPGHEEMDIGVEHVDSARAQRLHWMLALPCLRRSGRHPIKERTKGQAWQRTLLSILLLVCSSPRECMVHACTPSEI
jgi:hypothetical protein